MPDKNINKNQILSKNTEEEKNLTSKLIKKIYKKNIQDNIKIETILQSTDSGGFALLIFICSLILVIPTPPPIGTIMGILIMFFSFQMSIGLRNVWLPKFITKRSIPRKVLASAVARSSVYLYKMERFTRRRIFFINSDIAERIVGIVLFSLALLSLTPILFANTLPGTAMLFISFGILNKDGLLIILGFVVGFISLFVVWAMIVFGKAIILAIINKIF